MELISENKKVFTILFIIAILIIIAVLWWPEKDIELSKYEKLTEAQIDERVSKRYGDELKYALYSQDFLLLQENISKEYLDYNEISVEEYKIWLEENNLLTTSISFGNTTKYSYGDINIYSIDAIFNGNDKKINIIETYPEQWLYTFDTFVSFSSNELKNEQENNGVIINSIYQDLNYIEFDCSLFVDNNMEIDISKSDSIKLIMDDNTAFIMATNNENFQRFVLDGKEYINTKCIFNIPINSQDNISSIVFDAFYTEGESQSIKLNLDI